MNIGLMTAFWRMIHRDYAREEDLQSYKDQNSREHMELRQLIVNNHDEVKNLFIKYLGNK